MKAKHVLTLALGLAGGLSAQAQDAVFKVLASRGSVTAINNAEKNQITTGKKLFTNESIEVSGSSYVGLMHKSGKTIELKQPGVYAVKELDTKIASASGAGVGQRYANYVFGEITKDDKKDMKGNHQQYMAVTGAVSRAMAHSRAAAVNPLIPQSSILPNTSYNLAWLKVNGAPGYVVQVSDLYDEVLMQKETQDTIMAVDFSSIARLKNERMCMVKISIKGRPNMASNQHSLKFLTTEEANKLKKDIDGFKAETNPSAISKVAQAMFYEENELFLDALNAYREAMTLEPEVEDYRALYRDYLVRVGLAEENKAK